MRLWRFSISMEPTEKAVRTLEASQPQYRKDLHHFHVSKSNEMLWYLVWLCKKPLRSSIFQMFFPCSKEKACCFSEEQLLLHCFLFTLTVVQDMLRHRHHHRFVGLQIFSRQSWVCKIELGQQPLGKQCTTFNSPKKML